VRENEAGCGGVCRPKNIGAEPATHEKADVGSFSDVRSSRMNTRCFVDSTMANAVQRGSDE